MVPYSWLCQARRFFFISAFAPLLRLASCGADEETSTPPPAETASAAPTPTLTATDSPKSNIGSGPVFSDPWGVAVAVDGMLVVVDNGRKAVVRVAPATGSRTIICDADTGSGP